MHEDFTREEEVHSSSDRAFGFVMAAFFAIVAVIPLLHGPVTSIRCWALGISSAFLVFALIWAKALRPFNRLWLKLGLLISKIVSPIVLGMLFYATVTPVGLLMRAVGKDPLRLRRNAATKTYWIPRDPPGPAPDSMKQQF